MRTVCLWSGWAVVGGVLLRAAVAGEADAAGPLIVPLPKHVSAAAEPFRLGPSSRIVPSGLPAESTVPAFLAEELERLTGIRPPTGQGETTGADIRLLLAAGEHAGEYRLKVGPEGARLEGTDEDALFHAALGFLELVRAPAARRDGSALVVPGVSVRDWPDCPWRGYHMFMSMGQDFEVLEQAVRACGRDRFNRLVIGIGAWMAYESRPIKGHWSRDQVRTICALARRYRMEPIPFMEYTGHASGEMCPHLAPFIASYGMDMTCEGVWDFVRDTALELWEVFGRPSAVHIGGDECAAGLKANAEALGTTPEDVMARYINFMHGLFTRERGVDVIVYHDMLMPLEYYQGGSRCYSTTWKAIERIPKDVVISYWNYEATSDYRGVTYFVDKGFRVLGTTWTNPEHLIRDSIRKKQGVLGCTWASPLRFPGFSARGRMLTAEFAWNGAASPGTHDLRYDPLLAANRTFFDEPAPVAPPCDRLYTGPVPTEPAGWLEARMGRLKAPFFVVAPDGSRRPIRHINRRRGADGVSLYTDSHGRTTRNNETGAECAFVDGRRLHYANYCHAAGPVPPGAVTVSVYCMEDGKWGPPLGWLKQFAKDEARLVIVDADGAELDVTAPDPGLPAPPVVPVGRPAPGLILTWATTFSGPAGESLGRAGIRYADGERAEVEIVNQRNVSAVSFPVFRHEAAHEPIRVLPLSDGAFDSGRALFRYHWRNPRPEVSIADLQLALTELGRRRGFFLQAVDVTLPP